MCRTTPTSARLTNLGAGPAWNIELAVTLVTPDGQVLKHNWPPRGGALAAGARTPGDLLYYERADFQEGTPTKVEVIVTYRGSLGDSFRSTRVGYPDERGSTLILEHLGTNGSVALEDYLTGNDTR